jgi:hypothetical protein
MRGTATVALGTNDTVSKFARGLAEVHEVEARRWSNSWPHAGAIQHLAVK